MPKTTNMPMDLLRAFTAVVELGSVTKAGAVLGRSQPAVSLQLKRLEEIVAVPLFRRDNRAVELTEAGRALAGYAKRILELNDEAIARLQRDLEARGARLGIPNDFAGLFLADVLRAVDRLSLASRFEVVCDISAGLLAAFHKDELDIVLAMSDDEPDTGGLVRSWPIELTWVASAEHPPRLKDVVPLVLYPEGCRYRRRIIAALDEAGLPWKIVYSSSSLAGIHAAVKAGLGLTVLSRDTVPAGLATVEGDQRLPTLEKATVGLYVHPRVLPTKDQRLIGHIVAALDTHLGTPAEPPQP
jgi:DNA-binding transcriptional LysR family regulator